MSADDDPVTATDFTATDPEPEARAPRSRWARWRHALKPASWPKILVPAVLGQGLGVASTHDFSITGLVFGGAFAVLDSIFIVLLNDWSDQHVDSIKRGMFPDGCSPKTIPDGILTAKQVGAAGVTAGVGVLAIGVGGSWVLGRPLLAWGAVLSIAIFALYSLPPVRLNYRGGGELLEMMGVGVVLPWLNFHAQSGRVFAPELWGLCGFALLSLASAIASGIADEESDRDGGKKTVVTALGNRASRRIVDALVPIGAASWGAAALALEAPAVIAYVAAAAMAMWHYVSMRRQSPRATTNQFRDQSVYKLHLHRSIWYSAVVLAALLPFVSER